MRTAPIESEDRQIVGGVEIFSDVTGLIEAKDAAESARLDALTDPLTGLPNRRLLDTVLAARQDDLDRHGFVFGLLMVDIDHFKRVNDEFGHDVGDVALLSVALTIRGAIRTGDAVARWGGEEFAIVVSAQTHDGLHAFAERVRRIVRSSVSAGPRSRRGRRPARQPTHPP